MVYIYMVYIYMVYIYGIYIYIYTYWLDIPSINQIYPAKKHLSNWF